MQGYYFSRPLAVPELERMLREDQHLMLPDAQLHAVFDAPPQIDVETGLMSLQRLLNKRGYHILSERPAAEGFELLARCDELMPAMDSAEFLKRVEDLSPDSLRIILSGHANLTSLLDAINHGAIYRYTGPDGESRSDAVPH